MRCEGWDVRAGFPYCAETVLLVLLYDNVILKTAVGIGGWLVDGTCFVRSMEPNGIKSAFHTEISLFKAAINKQHRCSSNDRDFRWKCLMKTLSSQSCVSSSFTVWTTSQSPLHQPGSRTFHTCALINALQRGLLMGATRQTTVNLSIRLALLLHRHTLWTDSNQGDVISKWGLFARSEYQSRR